MLTNGGENVGVLDQKSKTTRRVTIKVDTQRTIQLIREEGSERVTIRRYASRQEAETTEAVDINDLAFAVEQIGEKIGDEK